MAVSDYKLTFTYTGPLGARWNEVYYQHLPSAVAGLTLVGSPWTARLSMLHPICILRSLTVADTANPRNVANIIVNYPGGYPNATASGSPAETSLVCNLVGQGGSRRKLWLRGSVARGPAKCHHGC